MPLLSPIYWTTAYEIGAAANGYTTTKGFFRRETQVNFATGELYCFDIIGILLLH